MTDPVTHQKEEGALEARMTATLVELAGIPSVSGQEAAVRAYVAARLDERLGLETHLDAAGNPNDRNPCPSIKPPLQPPVLLNAHFDLQAPGKAPHALVT